jgi:hypothetical protein
MMPEGVARMILKEADDRSEEIAALERAQATAPTSQQAEIKKQIARLRSGISGERSAAHFLNREFSESENLAVIHDLRLRLGDQTAQIDHLVMHRAQASIWVLETKNHSGRLTCDEHGDWTVWRGRKPQNIPSPVRQASRQCRLLEMWLKAERIDQIQKITPVVLISPESSVNRKELTSNDHVVKSDNFGAWWTKQAEALPVLTVLGMLGRHVFSGMSKAEFKALGERLVAAHVSPAAGWVKKARPIPEPPRASSKDLQGCRKAVEGATYTIEEQVPDVIATPFGVIKISQIPDGRYAIRNENNDELINLVKASCKGRATWNPRFRNWLASAEALPHILAAVQQREHS